MLRPPALPQPRCCARVPPLGSPILSSDLNEKKRAWREQQTNTLALKVRASVPKYDFVESPIGNLSREMNSDMAQRDRKKIFVKEIFSLTAVFF